MATRKRAQRGQSCEAACGAEQAVKAIRHPPDPQLRQQLCQQLHAWLLRLGASASISGPRG